MNLERKLNIICDHLFRLSPDCKIQAVSFNRREPKKPLIPCVGLRRVYKPACEVNEVVSEPSEIRAMYSSEYVIEIETGKIIKERIPFSSLLTSTEKVLYGE